VSILTFGVCAVTSPTPAAGYWKRTDHIATEFNDDEQCLTLWGTSGAENKRLRVCTSSYCPNEADDMDDCFAEDQRRKRLLPYLSSFVCSLVNCNEGRCISVRNCFCVYYHVEDYVIRTSIALNHFAYTALFTSTT
jgi:hypothetical protein